MHNRTRDMHQELHRWKGTAYNVLDCVGVKCIDSGFFRNVNLALFFVLATRVYAPACEQEPLVPAAPAQRTNVNRFLPAGSRCAPPLPRTLPLQYLVG